jgi:hypothetical protein
MAVRPSRVKLNNAAYPVNALSYQIKLLAQEIPVYKALNPPRSSGGGGGGGKGGKGDYPVTIVPSDLSFNWLGNPSINGTQDPDVNPSDTVWVLHSTYPVSAIYTGINIGRKVIYQNPNLAIGFKLVYVVSAPPYYKFEQISTENCPVIPYNYNTQYSANKKTVYMPFISTANSQLSSVFNPFQPSTTYTDINGNDTTVTNDPDYLNNITFNLLSAPSITNAVKSPNSTRYGIIVPGTNLKVSLYTGLYNNINQGNHSNPIWNAPVTSIPSTPNIVTNSLILRQRDASGAIAFSALQFPEDLGYPSGTSGYKIIFNTDNSSNWYNVDFKMENSSWFNYNTPVTYFDEQSHGIRPTLYTVVDVNDPLTQTNKRRVYKYTSSSSLDIDLISGDTNGIQTFNLTFNSRSYRDFEITKSNVFPSNLTSIWGYDDLVNKTIIPSSSISWTTDASYTNMAYVSWAFGNSTTSKNMLIELLGVQDTEQKWCYIHLEPFMRYLNQFNMQVGSVAWDGSLTTPLVNSRVIQLAPQLKEPVLQNNTYATQAYSESTL